MYINYPCKTGFPCILTIPVYQEFHVYQLSLHTRSSMYINYPCIPAVPCILTIPVYKEFHVYQLSL